VNYLLQGRVKTVRSHLRVGGSPWTVHAGRSGRGRGGTGSRRRWGSAVCGGRRGFGGGSDGACGEGGLVAAALEEAGLAVAAAEGEEAVLPASARSAGVHARRLVGGAARLLGRPPWDARHGCGRAEVDVDRVGFFSSGLGSWRASLAYTFFSLQLGICPCVATGHKYFNNFKLIQLNI
jgi:hypothetical protein